MLLNFLYFFLILLINKIQNKLLIIPIRSFKFTNIDVPFNDPAMSKWIDPVLTQQNFISNWLMQTSFLDFSVGTPPQKVKGEISLSTTLLFCVIDKRYQRENNFNFFNYTTTFFNVTKITAYKSFSVLSFSGAGYDNFYFTTIEDEKNKGYSTQKANLQITLDLRFADYQGINPENASVKEINQTLNLLFGLNDLKQLTIMKHEGLFDSYDFKVEYYKNPSINPNEEDDEVGRFIIGKFDKLYDNETYPEENLKSTRMVQYMSALSYAMEVTESYIQKKDGQRISITPRFRADIVFSRSLMIGDQIYSKEIEEEFFAKYGDLCEKNQAYVSSVGYDLFQCKPEIKKYKNEFPELKFYIKDFNYTFTFNYDDLFREYNDRTYFLVIFTIGDSKSNWVFGKIFLKKYELFFNPDEKMIKFYREEEKQPTEKKEEKEKSSSLFVKILLNLFKVILILGLFAAGYFIGKYLNKKRKLRAHELEDTYEYENTKDKNYKNVELN